MTVLMALRDLSWYHTLGLLLVGLVSAAAVRTVRRVYLHPLSKFPGPWYAAATSLTSAFVSWRRVESEWLLGLTKKYGTDTPIRITPSMLLFPRPSALKDIYWDPACNFKPESLYETGVLGPPQLFTTRDGEAHRRLRKALGGTQWSIGYLKKNWESRIDDQVRLFVDKMTEFAERKEAVMLCDKVAEFAADIMTMVSFTEPWGFVKNSRDERGLLAEWRSGLDFFGVAGRWQTFRRHLPRRPLRVRRPPRPLEKRAHITLLIQAGADTTATALGCTLRYLLATDGGRVLAQARAELDRAEYEGKLSDPIAYEEARRHLPYLGACIKEALRLAPPATNLFARLTPSGRNPKAKLIDGVLVPPGTEVTTISYVVHRDPELYAPDPETYRPERWLEAGDKKAGEMEAAQFGFGAGPRQCLGKEIANMELWKVVPQVVRRFDMEMLAAGEYVVAGGVAYNQGFKVRLTRR
ncbi:cytochrome P450 monooxygenase [Apiospora hydei]|uniref:Cytochrome P450 monooxygenase n=1 Tax=Apiospora hydei TaxID=1337664 RepID=A0ABR1X511_9PEZI